MTAVIHAKERKSFTNSSRRKARKQGQIPAVIYGKKQENKAILVSESELLKILREQGRNVMLNIQLDGENHQALLYELQHDPMKNTIIHADFYVVDMDDEVDIEVPIVLIGEAKGVREGGVLQQTTHEVEVRAKPAHIPSAIEVDVTNLEIDDTIHVQDIQTDGQFKILDEPETVVATILPPENEELDTADEQKSEEKEDGAVEE